jgi:hypothetical protein
MAKRGERMSATKGRCPPNGPSTAMSTEGRTRCFVAAVVRRPRSWVRFSSPFLPTTSHESPDRWPRDVRTHHSVRDRSGTPKAGAGRDSERLCCPLCRGCHDFGRCGTASVQPDSASVNPRHGSPTGGHVIVSSDKLCTVARRRLILASPPSVVDWTCPIHQRLTRRDTNSDGLVAADEGVGCFAIVVSPGTAGSSPEGQ